MKYRLWLCAWVAACALEALFALVAEGLDWFVVRSRRWADAAEVETLLARADRAVCRGRGR